MPIDKSFHECDWTTNYEWGECIKKHTKLWERELENIYSVLLTKFSTPKKTNSLRHSRIGKSKWNWKKISFIPLRTCSLKSDVKECSFQQ